MPDKNPVAIIGIGCLFPKSTDLKGYWQLLYHGKDAITDVPESHWSPAEYFDTDPKSPDHVYCKRGGFLEPVSFDPSEFGIPPSTLEATDTSQLWGLQIPILPGRKTHFRAFSAMWWPAGYAIVWI